MHRGRFGADRRQLPLERPDLGVQIIQLQQLRVNPRLLDLALWRRDGTGQR